MKEFFGRRGIWSASLAVFVAASVCGGRAASLLDESSEDLPAIETLRVNVSCANVNKYLAADNVTWTAVLKTQPGFVRKHVAVDPHTKTTSTCSLYIEMYWASYALWKSFPTVLLEETDAAFVKAYGTEVPEEPYPFAADPNGMSVLLNTEDPMGGVFPVAEAGQVIEFTRYAVACDAVDRFVAADKKSWTPFLQNQTGFLTKTIAMMYMDSDASTCNVYTRATWASRASWNAVCAVPSECAAVAKAFAAVFGSTPPMTRIPTSDGLDVVYGAIAPHGPRTIAIGGNDVVAYFSLKPGDRDVKGSPMYRRYMDASKVLDKELLPYHPQPYEFWFSSETNADLFDEDPWAYIPAFGGHCTHGIASGFDSMTPALLADGRRAFTCINTTEWYIMNNTLYMNSCGMYYDFIKDPEGDAAAAHARWKTWFGQERNYGPINDACFQDGQHWDGNPIGALIPDNCVLP